MACASFCEELPKYSRRQAVSDGRDQDLRAFSVGVGIIGREELRYRCLAELLITQSRQLKRGVRPFNSLRLYRP
jgi:hypothetical protein